MLSRRNRLRGSKSIEGVLRKGTRVEHRDAWARFLRADTDKQFALVVPRRVGNAVVRNAVRRRLGEALRRYLDRMPDGVAGVIVAKPTSAEQDFEGICSCVLALLSQAGLCNKL